MKENSKEGKPVLLNKKQRIWRICFIIVFLLTILAYCLLTYHTFKYDSTDPDIKYLYAFGPAIWVVYTGIPFIAILIGEYAFYRSIKASLRPLKPDALRRETYAA